MNQIACRVSADSMAPTLQRGDRVLVRRGRRGARPGAIAALRSADGALTVHRLIGRDYAGRWIAKGDAAFYPDRPWPVESLWGIVTARAVGRRWLAATTTGERLALVAARLRPWPVRRFVQRLVAGRYWTRPIRPERETVKDFASIPNSQSDDPFEVQDLGGELAVYDRRSGDVHVLNGVAGEIWTWSRQGADSVAILDRLSATYPEVERSRLSADVENTLAQLGLLKLLS